MSAVTLTRRFSIGPLPNGPSLVTHAEDRFLIHGRPKSSLLEPLAEEYTYDTLEHFYYDVEPSGGGI